MVPSEVCRQTAMLVPSLRRTQATSLWGGTPALRPCCTYAWRSLRQGGVGGRAGAYGGGCE